MSTFRIALPGNDVHTARIQDLAIDRRYPNPKIYTKANPPHTGIIFLNWASSIGINFQTTKILHPFKHNYNYIPTVFASYKFDNGSQVLRGTLPFQYGALGIITMDADDTNINLKYYSTDAAIPATTIPPFTMQIRFYVMAESGY